MSAGVPVMQTALMRPVDLQAVVELLRDTRELLDTAEGDTRPQADRVALLLPPARGPLYQWRILYGWTADEIVEIVGWLWSSGGRRPAAIDLRSRWAALRVVTRG